MRTAHRTSVRSLPRARPAVAWAWLLALSLLAAQALGLAHRVAHGPLQAFSLAAAHQASQASHAHAVHRRPATQRDSANQGHQGPFDQHEAGGTECRLLDQAAQVEALLVAALPALPPRRPAQVPAAARTLRAAGPACAYLARGPPARVSAGLHSA